MDNTCGQLEPGALNGGTDFPGQGAQTWRPARWLIVGLFVLAGAASAGALVLQRDPLDRVITGLVGGVLLVLALLGHRRRVIGGPRGLLIAGPTGSRMVPWSTVRAVGCGRTRRMGSATLEIDLVDDELLIFGRFELGSDPADVVAVLAQWFHARPSHPADD